MIATPTVSPVSIQSLSNLFGGFPLQLELSRVALLVLLLLVSVFFAALSVIFVYHWRRFPYEQAVFSRVEHLYFSVSIIFLAVALFGIVLS